MTASQRAFRALIERNQRVSFAESLTGGLIAATFIENPGASAAIDESYVTYAAEAKIRILGVSPDTVNTCGVVSAQCAKEMAEGVRRISGADWGVSATGLAGPDGGAELTPVGTVFIGIAGADGTRVIECHFAGRSRENVRRAAVRAALSLLAQSAVPTASSCRAK